MIISLKSFSKLEILALLSILVLAAVLRFAYPGVNSFAGDEARISLDALRMARGGEFVVAGQPSSTGIPFFPASVWMFALPYALSPDPLVATWFVSGVSLVTVLGVWWLGRRWGRWSGLSAALYMAASPYAVLYGRSIWQPNLLAPLATLWAITAYLGIMRSTRVGKVAIALSVFLGLLTVQVHFAGIALIPATIYLFVRFRWWKRSTLVPALIGAALGAAAAMPYVYYITVAAPEVLANYGSTLGGTAAIDGQGFQNLLRLALGWDWAFLGMGDSDTVSRNSFAAGTSALILLTGIGVLLIYAFIVLRERLSPQASASPEMAAAYKSLRSLQPLVEITLLLLLVSPLFFLRHSTPVLIHYQLIAMPGLALLAGFSIGTFATRALRVMWFSAPVLLAAASSVAIWTALDYTAVNRPPNSALSSILRESRDAAYGAPPPTLFFTHGDDPAIDGEVAVFKALLWERESRILNGDHLLILPPYPATLLATLAPFQAWEEIEASGFALDVQTYLRREGALPFIATGYDGVTEPQGFTMIDPIPFADGSTLLGWRVRRVGPRLRVSTLWRVTEDTSSGIYQQFHHLRSASAEDAAATEPLAISDVPLSRGTWRVGDRVIVMADFFDIAPGTEDLSVEIGHYTLPDLARIPLVGSAAGDSLVRLGTFTAP